ncbi:Type 1 glutamine amidotransferase-like domain-containing protein [Actinoplanes sp. Pm04-4]|uniref:Type 1 glutamine amidotransferase-like domain-containing protein n=1 Tax=Paractinoplanes pyxinae TaxID=2997416 RepID=A0ABT4BGE3_9ACTN|nr:Type 1 glutamine amidotransferase-like domain-containing protein [Actinoplanes pyxinae]MCY1145610.1 Type 1 glutamine amidotransferase-like domain-containing protein [Actinoplanes pyxinae]
MKLLLTDSGVRNPSIRAALIELLGKPIEESDALCIPTAGYGGPYGEPGGPWRFASGQADGPMVGLGWKSMGTLELTALPSIDRDRWVSWVREADVLLVNGGDTAYLARWMRESGLAEVLPSLHETVYVGLSAGSVVLTPEADGGLGVVDFGIFPHLNDTDYPEYRSLAAAEQWAAGIEHPGYALDAQSALQVVDGVVSVVSEGTWKLFDGAAFRG